MHLKSASPSARDRGYKTGHKPYTQQGTAKDLAPAVRVKNFRALHKLAGPDNLGVILGLTHQRLEQLLAGENFSTETAYHIETTLGLPSGFFDLLNPRLSKEQVERLRNLKSQDPDAELALSVDASSGAPARAPEPPAVALQKQTPVTKPAPADTPAAAGQAAPSGFSLQLASPLAGVPVRHKKKRNVTMTSQVVSTPQSVMSQQPVAKVPRGVVSAEEAQLRVTRANNLAMLTSGPGAKKQLCLLTGLTAANISHRLHGNKIFDRETADFFCEKLELPLGWFESPQTPAKVPARALALLGSTQASLSMPVAAPAAPKAAKARPQAAAPLVPASAANKPTARPAVAAPAQVAAPVAAPAAAAAAPVLSRVGAPAPVAAPQAQASAAQAPLVAQGPAEEPHPVADALVKTLLKMVREGRLPEEKALNLLVEVMAL